MFKVGDRIVTRSGFKFVGLTLPGGYTGVVTRYVVGIGSKPMDSVTLMWDRPCPSPQTGKPLVEAGWAADRFVLATTLATETLIDGKLFSEKDLRDALTLHKHILYAGAWFQYRDYNTGSTICVAVHQVDTKDGSNQWYCLSFLPKNVDGRSYSEVYHFPSWNDSMTDTNIVTEEQVIEWFKVNRP